MAKRYLSINLNKYGDADFETKSQTILGRFTDNPNFPDPDPSLAELDKLIEVYCFALSKCGTGFPKGNTVAKNTARKVLTNSLQKLAAYAERIADGNVEWLSDLGFDMLKTRKPVPPIAKATITEVMPLVKKGCLKIGTRKLENARYYEFCLGLPGANGAMVWTSYTYTRTKVTISGLISGMEYSIKVSGARLTPDRNWSNIVTSYVS